MTVVRSCPYQYITQREESIQRNYRKNEERLKKMDPNAFYGIHPIGHFTWIDNFETSASITFMIHTPFKSHHRANVTSLTATIVSLCTWIYEKGRDWLTWEQRNQRGWRRRSPPPRWKPDHLEKEEPNICSTRPSHYFLNAPSTDPGFFWPPLQRSLLPFGQLWIYWCWIWNDVR